MSTILRFEVEGRPLSWKRTNAVGGRKLTPKAQREYQRRVARAALIALGGAMLWPTGARYAVDVTAYMPDLRRVDLDNIGKNICDSLQPLVFADDSQVDSLALVRRLDRERPRVVVEVCALEADEVADVEITVRRRSA